MILRGNVFSKVLEMETSITVLIPNSFDRDGKYKVVYLLHGLCGRSGDIIDYTMLPSYIEGKDIVFIMPEVGRSFYHDMRYGQNYYSYIAEELPFICEKVFNISGAREDTAVIGLSMGGYGALRCGLSNPEKYGYIGAFSSPILFLEEGLNYHRENVENEEFINAIGEQVIRDFYGIFGSNLDLTEKSDISQILMTYENADIKPYVYMTCGKADIFYNDNIRMSDKLESSGFEIEFESWEGNHDWYFFDKSLKKAVDKIFK